MNNDVSNVLSDINSFSGNIFESNKLNAIIKTEAKNRKTPVINSILYNTLRL